MTAPRLVSLCSGYGGLDTAVERLTGATTVAHVECDAAPSRVLAARWPGVPNLGDVNLSGRWWSGIDHPLDPADFRRCELLMREVPAARHHFHLMRDVSLTWARYVDTWDELVALTEQEAPGIFDRHPQGTAPRLYQRMQQIRGVA